MASRIKNIIFDWSGTLSDDLSRVYIATMEVFRAFSMPEIGFDEFRREYEYPYMNFYRKYSPTISREQADSVFYDAIHRAGEPVIYPGAGEVVGRLHQRGIKMSLLSGVPQPKLEKEVVAYGFGGMFCEIHGSAYDKTERIHQLIERNGYSVSETAYVGDMVHDIETGKHAGVHTVAITWGYEPRERLLKAEPASVIDHILELEPLLRGMK